MNRSSFLKELRVRLKKSLFLLMKKSLEKAAYEQKLRGTIEKLEKIVPDIRDQYSSFELDDPYLICNVRNMHAFQMGFIGEVIDKFLRPVIVDIGDSSGTHLLYVKGLFSEKSDMKCLSVNLDEKAVEKIKAKGLEAVHARAEDLVKCGINADIFLCFEVLEHLADPCKFLRELAERTNAEYLIVTVPYLKTSRVGLHHMRNGLEEGFDPEGTHIFELSPEDWKLIFQFCGWRVAKERIYYQYPKRHWMRLLKPVWKKYDFEGFWGGILIKDPKWSSLYKKW